MADYLCNTVHLESHEPADLEACCDYVADLLSEESKDFSVVRQDPQHAVIRFKTPWEPPISEARLIRGKLGDRLVSWEILFEDFACGITTERPLLSCRGFLPAFARLDLNSVELNFESSDGF